MRREENYRKGCDGSLAYFGIRKIDQSITF